MNSNAGNKQIMVLLYITCFISGISQLPFLWGSGFISLLYTIGWFGIFGMLLSSNARCFHYHFGLVALLVLFDIVVFIGCFFTGRYANSNFIRPLHLSVFIFFIGLMLAEYVYENELRKLSFVYILATGIVVLYVYFETFRGVDWASNTGYLFQAKNSITTIILTAIVLCGVYWWKSHKLICSAIMLLFSIIIFMMKARAAIFILIFLIIYTLLFVIKSPFLKCLLTLCFIGFVFYVMKNEELYNLIVKQIILDNREYDIDTFTTGRNAHYEYFFQQFPSYWWNGTGGTYLECFPLAALLSYGVLGGGALILLAVMPVFILLSYKSYYVGYNHSLKKLLTLLCIAVITNGIFEELAPFGPGVKCYMLWFISGLVYGKMIGGYTDE